MQLIEHPWGVAVQSVGIVSAPPDMVRIRLRITRVEQTPSVAFDAAGEALARVREGLRRHGVAEVKESKLDLRTLWSYGEPTQTLVGYQCQAAVAVESSDLDDLRQLLVDAVAAGANEIDSVEFDVRSREELQEQAHRRAVAAARHKASVYAEAAGLRLGAVLHIEDADPQPPVAQFAMRASAPGEELTPGEITVSTAVRVGFALAAPA